MQPQTPKIVFILLFTEKVPVHGNPTSLTSG